MLRYPETYRAAEVAVVLRAAQRRYSIQVCGSSGSGKSHLLRFLAWHPSVAAHMPQTRLLRAYLDCNALVIDSAAGLFRALALEFRAAQQPVGDALDALVFLREQLSAQLTPDAQLLIVLDRVERLPQAMLPAALDGLRHLRDYLDRRVSYILGSRVPLPIAAISPEFDDLLAHPPVVWVGPLNDADARWNTDTLLAEQHASASATERAALVELSGGHPRLLRAIVLAWVDLHTFETEALLHDGQIARVCQAIWDEIDATDQPLIHQLAFGQPAEITRDHRLVTLGLVSLAPAGPQLTSNLFAAYVRGLQLEPTLDLTALEQQLWELLHVRPNELIRRDELVAALYGQNPDGVNDEALTALAGRVRRKLHDAGLGTIEAMRGQGYRFVPAARSGSLP